MFIKHKLKVAVASVLLLAGGSAAAVAATGPTASGSTAAPVTASPLSADVAAEFTAFKAGATDGTAGEPALLEASARQGKRDPALGVPVVDFARAVPVPVVDSQGQKAWIAPSGDKVCVVLLQVGGGLGTSCQTIDAIKQGYGLTVAYGAKASTVISVAADGQQFASVTDRTGASKGVTAAKSANDGQNAVAAVLSNENKVAFGDGNIDLGAFNSER